MKHILVMLGWMNVGGTRQPKGNGYQASLAAALILLLSAPGAWAGVMISTVTPSNGPAAGGNVVVVTNTSMAIGNGSDITNVVFDVPDFRALVAPATPSPSTTNILGQGTNWVRFAVPAHAAGPIAIGIQSTSEGWHYVPYAYNPAGEIGHESYSEWINMGGGMNDRVSALALDPAMNLYAGGYFSTADSMAVKYIAKWNGTTWTNLGSGMNSAVTALTSDTNGNLYVGGSFTNAGGVAAKYIAKWDGTTWTSLGSGLGWGVNALALDTNGNLYAGGMFTNAGGVAANYTAKWNGTTWTNLGAGMNTWVRSLALDTDGNLYAGGDFTNAGGVAANYIAKWNGTT